jgi:hypothetical protein
MPQDGVDVAVKAAAVAAGAVVRTCQFDAGATGKGTPGLGTPRVSCAAGTSYRA